MGRYEVRMKALGKEGILASSSRMMTPKNFEMRLIKNY
jgi:hypothetical protein